MDMMYFIEEIKDKRKNKGRIEFLVKWKDYDSEDNTWEARVDLIKGI